MILALLLSLFGEPQAVSPLVVPADATELKLVVAAPVYSPDGSIRSETATMTSPTEFVFGRQSVCDPMTTADREPLAAGYGWRVSSRIIDRTSTSLVVALTWQRLWDAGRRVTNGPADSVELTLHPGDRMPLDQISNVARNENCRAVGVGLEVRITRVALALPPIEATLPLGASVGGAQAMNADLWLIHARPAGAEEVLHQQVRLPAAGAPFEFTPLTFTTTRGEVTVTVDGALQMLTGPADTRRVILQMSRVVTGAGAPAAGFGGRTTQIVPLPAPSDVLSFEESLP